MVTLDDFEVDFEGAVTALAEQVAAEIERETAGMSEAEILFWRVERSMQHLGKMYQFDAPDFLIKQAHKRQRKQLTALRDYFRRQRA